MPRWHQAEAEKTHGASVQAALVQDLAVGEHEHALGHARGDVEVVGHEQGRDFLARELAEERAQEIAARDGVEAREALVEQQELRRLRQRGGEHRARGLAAREVLERALERHVPVLGERERALVAPGRVLRTQEAEELGRRHPRRVVRRIGHVGDLLAQRSRLYQRIEAEHLERARVGLQEPEQEPQERALALAVRTEQHGHTACRQLETDVREHGRLPEAFRQMLDLHDGIHADLLDQASSFRSRCTSS
ncbi:MAG: hypothetical protein ABL998_17670 [Planctomycetota bacterium]